MITANRLTDEELEQGIPGLKFPADDFSDLASEVLAAIEADVARYRLARLNAARKRAKQAANLKGWVGARRRFKDTALRLAAAKRIVAGESLTDVGVAFGFPVMKSGQIHYSFRRALYDLCFTYYRANGSKGEQPDEASPEYLAPVIEWLEALDRKVVEQ